MTMRTYKGFNFGPTIGPVRTPGEQGRWVHIYREPTPLLWGVDKWLWYDDPEPRGGDDPIGGGRGGGGGSGSSGGKGTGGGGGKGPGRNPLDCLEWTRVETGNTPSCNDYIRAIIKDVVSSILTDPRWREYLSLFDSGSLWRCITGEALCNLEIDCSYPEVDFIIHDDEEINQAGKRPFRLNVGTTSGGKLVDHYTGALLFGLIRACGGTAIEAMLLTEANVADATFTWTISRETKQALLDSETSKGRWRLEDFPYSWAGGGTRKVYVGKYIWYDPVTGKYGPYPLPDFDLSQDDVFRDRWKIKP